MWEFCNFTRLLTKKCPLTFFRTNNLIRFILWPRLVWKWWWMKWIVLGFMPYLYCRSRCRAKKMSSSQKVKFMFARSAKSYNGLASWPWLSLLKIPWPFSKPRLWLWIWLQAVWSPEHVHAKHAQNVKTTAGHSSLSRIWSRNRGLCIGSNKPLSGSLRKTYQLGWNCEAGLSGEFYTTGHLGLGSSLQHIYDLRHCMVRYQYIFGLR